MSVECSATKWTSIVYTLQVQGPLWKRGLKKKMSQRLRREEVQNEKVSYGYDRTATHKHKDVTACTKTIEGSSQSKI